MTPEDWDPEPPQRGQVVNGMILAIHDYDITVDVGAKRDGNVLYADLQRMDPDALQKLPIGGPRWFWLAMTYPPPDLEDLDLRERAERKRGGAVSSQRH
jgi:hypothetical protein